VLLGDVGTAVVLRRVFWNKTICHAPARVAASIVCTALREGFTVCPSGVSMSAVDISSAMSEPSAWMRRTTAT
jgi:hypothetical protein